MQTPISQISSPHATPAPANRAMPSGTAPDGDFQRTLNRQLEQRQASSRAQPQAPAQAAAKPAAPAPAPGANKAAEQARASSKEAAPADKDSEGSESEQAATAEAKLPNDPIADMLALVGSIKLAMQPPANGDAAAGDAGERALARLDGKLDGKNISAAQLLAGQKIETDSVQDDGKDGDFAARLGKAQAGASGPAAKLDAGKLALDAQLAATARTGAALAEPLPKEAAPDLTRLAAPLAPGALQQAAAVAAVPTDKLMGRVGTPAWDQQLGQKVVWMASGGDQSATLTLHPPDLGPLQVVLTVTNDQADAAFMSAQPEVRQALEAALPRLRDMMSEAGIAFGNATVSDGTAQQQNKQRDGHGGGRGGNQGGVVSGGEIAITQSASRSRPSAGEVDTFA
ncbi:flagellar hook-length control protein FliK [Janthinobacterium sp. PC23-8]|uniref:flagellar hook-length control protein FliK n=1 Tax=Janthinobacterium sp. PC23-8 TaxID=2012679 RepID=UPI000B961781|nr:flagellar hook-length control protein FliK [Janthinobacterium sp. PC23-8]OYO30449.1 hypothetical protein CD932_04365 [Janthinobacterium sp. PC23-8]